MTVSEKPPNVEVAPLKAKDLTSKTKVTWCPGCGDYALLAGVRKALAALGRQPKDVAVVSGIGCSSNFPHFLSAYGFHSIHGRALPVATGVKLARPELTVIVAGGDGDGLAIGAGHFVHGMRRNLDMTYTLMDNEIYGLTTGQASPTSLMGHKTKSTPEGVIEHPLNPPLLAIASGATFVARGFSGDNKHLTDLVQQAIEHKGFSFIDVLSPCVTFNKWNTYDWFRGRVYKLEDEGHDPSDLSAAMARAMEFPTQGQDKVPIGLFYKTDKPTYEDLEPALQKGSLLGRPVDFPDRESVLKEFR